MRSFARGMYVLNLRMILGAVLVLMATGVGLANRAVAAPNIIIIMTDDHGADAVEIPGFWNGLNCHTPNLATLASRGRIFVNARVNPLCSPTRAGLMTGRNGISTGVIHIASKRDRSPLRETRALQTYEYTLAEMLQDQGYDTLLVGKWHLGVSAEYGQRPRDQGFDVFLDGSDFMRFDDPLETGDELLSLMIDKALQAEGERGRPENPYALFFLLNDPHERHDGSGREELLWWKVDESLLPSGEDYYAPENDTNQNRYRAVIEAVDTETPRLLYQLGVVDRDLNYRPESNTIVFFLGDNGTPGKITDWFGKGHLTDGGIHVPLFVFGEGVPSDGTQETRLVSHTDLYETIADVVGIAPDQRGDLPRDSMSFADRIGWSDPLPEREFTISNRGVSDQVKGQFVALTDGRFKLIASAGGPGLAPLNTDQFYDMERDPWEEDDLIITGITTAQKRQYHRMRDRLVDYWFSSVCEPTPLMVDVPLTHALALSSDGARDTRVLPLGHLGPGSARARESRIFLRFDIEAIGDLLPPGRSFEDVESAQIVIRFDSDQVHRRAMDTGLISPFRVTRNWYSRWRSWDTMYDERDTVALGAVDMPPHILPGGDDGPWIPIERGTPVSLGHNVDLLQTVRNWQDGSAENHGVVLLAEPLGDLGGDQRLKFRPSALLRLTLREP